MMDISSPKRQPGAGAQQRIGSLVVKSKGIGQYLKKVAEQNAEDATQAKNNELKENVGTTDSTAAR